jgi:hypothetical protein
VSPAEVDNHQLAAYARALADQLPGGSLERLSAGCAQVVLAETKTPTGARRILTGGVRQRDVRDAALQFLDEVLSLVGGIMGGMATVPPFVMSRTAGGPAYLLEWQELPDGTWGAEIAWLEWDGTKWAGRRGNVLAADIRQVDGQNYGAVPRIKAAEMARRRAQH